MGYFSNLAAQDIPYEYDHSITSPEKQLLWRLEDLEERLRELTTQRTGKRDEGVCFSESDLRYALPGQFFSVSDVRKAIELAVNDLADRYGIYVRDELVEEAPEMDEITGMQISFLDILSVQSLNKHIIAAYGKEPCAINMKRVTPNGITLFMVRIAGLEPVRSLIGT